MKINWFVLWMNQKTWFVMPTPKAGQKQWEEFHRITNGYSTGKNQKEESEGFRESLERLYQSII